MAYHFQSRVEAVVYSHRSGGPYDLSPYLVSFSASKRIDQPEGAITLAIKYPGYDPREVFDDDDWVFIRQTSIFGKKKHRLAFINSTSSEERVVSGGAVSVDYTIQCGDAGKPFARHEFVTLVNVPYGRPGFVPPIDEITRAIETQSLHVPTEVMRRYMQTVFRPPKVKTVTPPEEPKKKPGTKDAKPAQGKPAQAPGEWPPHFPMSGFQCGKSDKAGLHPLPTDVQNRLRTVVAPALEALRTHIGDKSIHASGYRCAACNAATGGKKHSYHRMGFASDISVAGMSPLELAKTVQSAVDAGVIPYKMSATQGLGLLVYKKFVHIDWGDSSLPHPAGGHGQSRPYVHVMRPGEVSAANAVTDTSWYSAIEGWKPNPTQNPGAPDPDTTSTPDEAEGEEQTVPIGDTVEAVASGSGDGAFVVPASLSGLSGEKNRWDWVDACDMQTYCGADSVHEPHGRWWVKLPLYWQKATVHSFIASQADPVFCELFYDTRPGSGSKLATMMDGWGPSLIYRRRPFDAATWTSPSMGTLQLSADLLATSSLSRGGAERFQYFMARTVGQEEKKGPLLDLYLSGGRGVVPAIDVNELYPHGLRTLDVEGRFIFPDVAGSKPDNTLVDRLIDANATLYRWNRPLPDFWGGTLTFLGFNPDALVGNKLELLGHPRHGDMHYYIEGVSESWAIDRMSGKIRASTTLQVTRGQPLTEYAAPEPTPWKQG